MEAPSEREPDVGDSRDGRGEGFVESACSSGPYLRNAEDNSQSRRRSSRLKVRQLFRRLLGGIRAKSIRNYPILEDEDMEEKNQFE